MATDHNAIKGRVEPEVLDPPVERDCSRLICIYGLRGVKDPELDLAGPETFLELGRFERHYESVAEGMPRFTAAATWTAAPLETSRGTVGSLRGAEARLGIVKYSGSALVLWLDIEVDLTEAIVLLQETCFRYETLRIDGVRPLDAVRKVQPGVPAAFEKAEFDQEVHQIFAPSSALTVALRGGKEASLVPNPDPLLRLVYREDRDFRPEGSAMRYPKELNRPVESICAHGRGVTVLGGAARHVEDGVILTALELATSAGCLRRVRADAVEALESASRKKASADEALQIVQLARELRRLEADLSFGVDRYLDSLRLPEIVLGAYRRSLAEMLELGTGVEASANMVQRLQRIIAARQLELETAQAAAAGARRTSADAALAYFSIAATIFALLKVDYYYVLLGLVGGGILVYGAARFVTKRRLPLELQ